MPIASSKPDSPTAIHLAHAQEYGKRTPAGGDFAAALTEAAASTTARTGTTQVVKTGDTLYGIANARLAASGARSDPGASMRYALQIAQSNGIRDPNRIYAGQTLDLARPPASTSVRSDPSGSIPDAGNGKIASTATLDRRSTWETRIVEDMPRDPTDELEFDVPEVRVAHPETDAEVVSDAKPVSAPTDAGTRLAIARYNEAAASNELAAPPAIRMPVAATDTAEKVPDIFYKGLVGKALDALPMDASARTGLQQTNAVIGSTFAGRSLAALTGVGGPILTLAGLVWGLFSAQKIAAAQPAEAGVPAQTARPEIAAARE